MASNKVRVLWFAVLVLLWLLHQKGLFDPIYDWWEDHFSADNQNIRDTRRHRSHVNHHHVHDHKHHRQDLRHHKYGAQRKRRSIHTDHRHNHPEKGVDYNYYLHHVHKEKHKHGHIRSLSTMQHLEDNIRQQHKQRKERDTDRGYLKWLDMKRSRTAYNLSWIPSWTILECFDAIWWLCYSLQKESSKNSLWRPLRTPF